MSKNIEDKKNLSGTSNTAPVDDSLLLQASSLSLVAPTIEMGEVDNKKIEAIQCGTRIRKFRGLNGLTLDELSDLTKMADPEGAGVSKVTISRYENADSLPGFRELKLLSHAFGVPISRFFYEGDDPFGSIRPTIEELIDEKIARAAMGGMASVIEDLSPSATSRRAFNNRFAEIRRKRVQK